MKTRSDNLIEPLLGLKYSFNKSVNESFKKLNRTTFGIEIAKQFQEVNAATGT